MGDYPWHHAWLHGVYCAFLFSVLTIWTPTSASPWTIANNELLIISSANYFSSALEAPNNQNDLIESEFKRLDSDTYIEFGLTDNVMIGGKIVYGTSWLTRGADIETATGFSEVEAFGQYQLFHSSHDASSIRLSLARPSGFSSGARSQLQSDAMDVEIAVLYGRNLYNRRAKLFATIDAGYRKRLGKAADQIRVQTTIGYEPSKRFLFLIDAFATLSIRNEDFGGADFDIIKIQPSALWRFSNHWGLQVGVTEEVTGRNITLGRSFFVGMWSSF